MPIQVTWLLAKTCAKFVKTLKKGDLHKTCIFLYIMPFRKVAKYTEKIKKREKIVCCKDPLFGGLELGGDNIEVGGRGKGGGSQNL